ncbi:KAT8 regulatory NSL complex subunit 1-like [Tubulanus polymorphus]|uniref:KAT8 regulatory NSL complex subunit 1-like n=1 Tax=Tubulanus polymorphus TaxID=672921 RepID=UPI003DA6C6B3
MYTPLPLRLCCRANMAPALTEAATHSQRIAAQSTPAQSTGELDDRSLTSCFPMQKLCTLSKTTLLSLSRNNGFLHHRHSDHAGQLLKSPLSLLNIESVRKFPDAVVVAGDEQTTPPGEYADSMNQHRNQTSKLPEEKTEANHDTENKMVVNLEQTTGLDDEESESDGSNRNPCDSGSIPAAADDDVAGGSRVTVDTERSGVRAVRIPPPASRPRSPQEDRLGEVTRRQKQQEKRSQYLLRRLRRLQACRVHDHSTNQMTAFVHDQMRNLETTVATSINNERLPELKAELLHSDDIKNMSTASLVNLVRKLQTSTPAAVRTTNSAAVRAISLKQRLAGTGPSTPPNSVIHLDAATRTEIDRKAFHLERKISCVETRFDSDATESSSGGESCDEDSINDSPVMAAASGEIPSRFTAENEQLKYRSLSNRAEYKWEQQRSSVAARWTWLQAQVSDLEYLIRQQTDIYRHIRSSKGAITLGDQVRPSASQILTSLTGRAAGTETDPTDSSPCHLATILNNIDNQSKQIHSLPALLTPVNSPKISNHSHHHHQVNGLVTTHPEQTTMDSSSSWQQAARCRPISNYRKRKLLRTFGLHEMNVKSARLSTVKCHCYPPLSAPCVMCGGRYNNTVAMDTETMSIAEKVSLLDNSFHRVLSFPQDIPLRVHLESLMKTGQWQNRHNSISKSAAAGAAIKINCPKRKYRKHKLPDGNDKMKNHQTSKGKLSARSAASLLTHKYRTKYNKDGKVRKRGRPLSSPKIEKSQLSRSEIRKKRAARLAALKKRRSSLSFPYNRFDRERTPSSSTLTSPRDTPPPGGGGGMSQSCPHGMLREMKDLMRKRRLESDYDINNIVIPYSIAAATRVTKLEYKEIVTPKWRDLTRDEPSSDEVNLIQSVHTSDNDEPKPQNHNPPTPQIIVKKLIEETEDIENLSDIEFAERHLRCEIQEKRRFMTYKTNLLRRARSSRTDSGTATPDPLSPDCFVETPAAVASPPPPQTPSIGFTFKDDTRRRSSSFSGLIPPAPRRDRSVSSEGRQQSIFIAADNDDEFYEEEVLPWQPRTFPISEDELTKMKSVTDDDVMPVVMTTRTMDKLKLGTPASSNPGSPLPSTSSTSSVTDDPYDPEWTILDEREDEQNDEYTVTAGTAAAAAAAGSGGNLVMRLHRR